MDNRMINQRPSDDQSRREERGLSRWEEPRRLSRYGAWTSPFELMRRFSEDVDRLFESLGFPRLGWPFESTERALARPTAGTTATTAWTPSVEVFARGDDLVVRADLPGVKPEDVSVEAEDNNLIIRGETRAEHERQEEGYYYSERQYGSFYRSIPLPQGVRADNAQATFSNGVLEITLPGAARAVQPQRRRIQIQSAKSETTQPQVGPAETTQQAGMGTQVTGTEQPHTTT
jgi:HSP20 family protein